MSVMVSVIIFLDVLFICLLQVVKFYPVNKIIWTATSKFRRNINKDHLVSNNRTLKCVFFLFVLAVDCVTFSRGVSVSSNFMDRRVNTTVH